MSSTTTNQRTAKTPANWSPTAKAIYTRQADSKLADLKTAVADVRSRAYAEILQHKAELDGSVAEIAGALDDRVKRVARRLDRLKAAGFESWEDLKAGLEREIDDLADVVRRATGLFSAAAEKGKCDWPRR